MYGWEVASSFELCNYPFLSISMANALAAALSTYSRDGKVFNCSVLFLHPCPPRRHPIMIHGCREKTTCHPTAQMIQWSQLPSRIKFKTP